MQYDIEAFISKDLKTIYVDQNVYYYVETRFRFSVAHELGHCILHKNFYSQIQFKNEKEWLDVQDSLDNGNRNVFEDQAQKFASFVLIPDYLLDERFQRALSSSKHLINMAEEDGLTREDYFDSAIDKIATALAPSFNVSHSCMMLRISRDFKYKNQIP